MEQKLNFSEMRTIAKAWWYNLSEEEQEDFDTSYDGIPPYEFEKHTFLQVFNGSVHMHHDNEFCDQNGHNTGTVYWLGGFGESKYPDVEVADTPRLWNEGIGWVPMELNKPIRFNPRKEHCVLAFGLNVFVTLWT